MRTRELDPSEWAPFFEAFSRQYRGRPVTLELAESGPFNSARFIAQQLPLVGITAEPELGPVKAIEIVVGAEPENHLCHIVSSPSHVKVGQISNGEDGVLVIESASDPTVLLAFRPGDLPEPEDAALGANPDFI
jgi:Family of unknown function (DUF5335)